jgi:Ni2+-binding GTPase involved in maturation of urease and hydrogenase
MKYKEQALKKLEKIEHKVAALESAISRSEDRSVVAGAFREMREAVANLRDTISIENDGMNY